VDSTPQDDIGPTDDVGELRLTFRPLKASAPAASRYRLLLKIALRSLGLRCTKIENVQEPPPAQPAPPKGPPP
jgi:hypothetical protein